ncbi:TetR/AcrR family transcriptional regulator [Aurantibacter crassamenti]|uniref:TetR/AcrR family transcriptional regulator n=1 Tax=Aurantibacter crassamenti TaxID=1837375 RepID=UPI00193A1712|nr:TetR/AcrR family transcriptional regulator [Aurantibacter crassamenti]MBM1107460.1 TetR/AcrR family transcriptional regulator [Aurantibacter crassamenti]
MSSKAERTSQFIIETVAPVFNKHGYVGTSMSDLTEATGLTKGAIYGNFENKEALALSAYEYNSKRLLSKIDELLEIPGTALDKIYNLTKFYKQYDVFTFEMGGCPVLNTGVDAFNNNKLLSVANREILREIEGKIALVLENGANKNELSLPVTPLQFAKQLFTMLQGAVTMFTISQDRKYLINTVTYLDLLIKNELKK